MVRGLTYLPKILIVLIIVLLFFSCGDKYCNESGIGMPLVGVYALETPPVEAKINSVTIYGVDQVNDSILYNNVSNDIAYTVKPGWGQICLPGMRQYTPYSNRPDPAWPRWHTSCPAYPDWWDPSRQSPYRRS